MAAVQNEIRARPDARAHASAAHQELPQTVGVSLQLCGWVRMQAHFFMQACPSLGGVVGELHWCQQNLKPEGSSACMRVCSHRSMQARMQ